ncbi:O-antigen ligase family protein [Bradyrhizobium sp. CB1650]|uniref:O-antigen ligase family protein n=1 Tax=Bradyrhizobium sp. CB1650 TaxID=3039153 RepID=UPI0024360069|nr:O-antigen ligase family protein [Bradyrhizobium sp. CB1650]WGD54944.1 O-antigen ligase family protein [Bradyrhizobium sp. CB1650]
MLLTFVLIGLLLLLSFVTGVRQMTLAIMVIRPSCDRVFEWLRDASGGLFGPGAALNAIVIGMALVAIIYVPGLALSTTFIAWFAFVLAGACSLLRTPDPEGGLRLLLALITYAAVFMLPHVVIKDRKTMLLCFTVAIASSVVPSSFALLEIAMDPAILAGDHRLQSTFTHPNIYAFYLLSVVILILFLNASKRIALSILLRRTMFAYAGYLLFLLLLTKTRSAWLAMLVVLVAYSVVVDRRWLLPVLLLPALAVLIPGTSERLSDLESGTIAVGFEQLNSLAWRELLWRDTLEWLRDNPPGLLGYGLNSFQSYVPLFFSLLDAEAGTSDVQQGLGLHNGFLQIYFEMGLVGLIAFTFLMGTIAFKLIAAFNKDFAGSFVMLMLCVGYMIVLYYDNLFGYLQFQWFFWFTVGTVCASQQLASTSHSFSRLPVASRTTRVPSSATSG